MPTGAIEKLDLDTAYKLTSQQIEHFRTQGFVKLKDVLSREVLDYYGQEITRQVIRLNTQQKPLAERDTYGKAFLQIGNIWLQSEIAKEFVFSKRLARIAAELMGTRGVRLYHDQALYKEAGGGITPWHADQQYWPLSNSNSCTVWVPFQHTPIEMGPLAFAVGSHGYEGGRNLAISDESEEKLQQMLAEQNFRYEESPFDLGEVSYHYGWTYHRAGPNSSGRPRAVMTVIYMDDEMRVAQPTTPSQENDLKHCLPGRKVGDLCETPINPVLYRA